MLKNKSKNFVMFSNMIREKLPDENIKIKIANVYLYNSDIYMLRVVVESNRLLTISQQEMIENVKLDGWKIYDEEFREYEHLWYFYPQSSDAWNLFTQAMLNARKASKETINDKLNDLKLYVKGLYISIV